MKADKMLGWIAARREGKPSQLVTVPAGPVPRDTRGGSVGATSDPTAVWRKIAVPSPATSAAIATVETDPIFGGVAISDEELSRWKEAAKRFDVVAAERIDLYTQPSPPRTKQFLDGESEYMFRDGLQNLVNNPMQLLRPVTISSLSNMEYYNGNTYFSSDSFSFREKAGNYHELVKTYEAFMGGLFSSLNEPDAARRKAQVDALLKTAFHPDENDYVHRPVTMRSKNENPMSWLVYGVLNVLASSSQAITPLARLRALELLAGYPAAELAAGFRSNKEEFHNGYDRHHAPRIPRRFCSREERLEKNHKDVWKKNATMQRLLVRDDRGRVDARGLASQLIDMAPETTVTVGLALMHDASMSEAGLALLQAIPKLDRRSLELALGPKASYWTDTNQTEQADNLVREGLGLKEGGEANYEGLTRDDLIQMLRRKDANLDLMREEQARNDATRERILEEMEALKGENYYLRALTQPSASFGGLKSRSLWTDDGTVTRRGDTRMVGLGDGVCRYEFSDGTKRIEGLTHGGEPVTHYQDGRNEWWMPDILGKTQALRAVLDKSTATATLFEFDLNGDGAADFILQQFPPTADGACHGIVERAGSGEKVHVYSCRPLGQTELRNVARAVHAAPPGAFAPDSAIYALTDLGETRTPGGPAGTVGGAAVDSRVVIHFDMLGSEKLTQHILFHEIGHVKDVGPRPDIFGSGQLVTTYNREADLKRSSFVSEYASRNATEDFAETHRFTLLQRAEYNRTHRGEDLFKLPVDRLASYLSGRQLSQDLCGKIEAIVSQYRALDR